MKMCKKIILFVKMFVGLYADLGGYPHPLPNFKKENTTWIYFLT